MWKIVMGENPIAESWIDRIRLQDVWNVKEIVATIKHVSVVYTARYMGFYG